MPTPAGFKRFLLKFDGVEQYKASMETFGAPQGYGGMAHAYDLMAKTAGIDMACCELLLEGPKGAFYAPMV